MQSIHSLVPSPLPASRRYGTATDEKLGREAIRCTAVGHLIYTLLDVSVIHTVMLTSGECSTGTGSVWQWMARGIR